MPFIATPRVVDMMTVPSTTQTAGTAITGLIYPKKIHEKTSGGVLLPNTGTLLKTRLSKAVYTAAATAHNLLALKCLGKTYLTAAAAASQAVIAIAADPGTGTVAGAVASGDYLVIRKSDGTYHLGIANGAVSSLTITLTANVPTGGFAAGEDVYFLGATGDSHVHTLACPASATTTFEGDALLTSEGPILLYSANATNAGTLVSATGVYTKG